MALSNTTPARTRQQAGAASLRPSVFRSLDAIHLASARTFAADDRFERKLPALSGLLATLAYVAPGLGRAVRPLLEKRGAKVKAALRRGGS